ncbi:MAG: hypothetical protein ABI462_06895 [Ignavibacteria bacterium]
MKNKFEIFLDTDIFSDHLKSNAVETTLLSRCLAIFDGCYTSVINASELFSECKSPKMIENTKKMFGNVGILGIPFRYSLKISEAMREIKKKNRKHFT